MDLNCKCEVLHSAPVAAATTLAVKGEEKRQKQAPNVGWFLLLQKGKQLHT